jgi:hypothetical protein
MKTPLARITGLLILTLLLTAQVPAPAPSPNPEAATAARELMDTMKLTDQFKAILPTIFQQLKPAIVQNRPEVERDLDSFMPILADKMGSRLGELENAIALIYASNFTAAELRELTAFYKTSTGQKFLQKMPTVTAQTMAAGQKFGQSTAADAQKQILDALRSKGHQL